MSAGRGLVGGTLMVLGALFLLDAGGVLDAGSVVGRWWPVLFVALGLTQAASERRFSAVSLVLLAIGGLLLLVTTGALGRRAWSVTWPVVVTLAGAWLVTGWGRAHRSPGDDPQFARLSFVNSVRLASRATALRRVALTAVLGKLRLDLTEARPHPGGARVSAASVFGHIDLIVPEGWAVEVRGVPIAGAWDDTVSRRGVGAHSPRLDVHVLAVIGGVEVKHKPRWG
jgi:predicted membrane protein